MPDIKQLGAGLSTSRRMFINSTDGKTGSSGLTPEITVALPGTVFSTTLKPLTTDIGRGWYDVQITTAHTPIIGEVVFSYVATAGQDPSELKINVTQADWSDVSSVVSVLSSVETVLASVSTKVNDIYNVEFGAWRVDTTADTLTLFKKGDTTTSVAVFGLTRQTGTQPYYSERTT